MARQIGAGSDCPQLPDERARDSQSEENQLEHDSGLLSLSSEFSRARDTILKYKVVLEASEEGFAASVPGLPGCPSQGATEQEALENITDAIREYLTVAFELSRGKVVHEVEIEV